MRVQVYISLVLVMVLFVPLSADGQTNEFTYQGRLTDGGMQQTAFYDFEFRLYDALTAGAQLGSTQQILGVQVTNGVFTVRLDFGPQFLGPARYLEISVKNAPGPFTVLAPRQPITSTPYAVRSLNAANATNATTATNATQLGGVAANQFVQTNNPALTDARNPLAGSTNYIQNTATVQASTDFNISGTGAAGILNAGMQYNLEGLRVLTAAGNGNLFVGQNAGISNQGGGQFNSFFGESAGAANTTGQVNSFFGHRAGDSNTTASNNSFFGHRAGDGNTTGAHNSFFGSLAGNTNLDTWYNSFFGSNSGSANTGANNSFFGAYSGALNTTATDNAFFGVNAGKANTTAGFNAFFGSNSGAVNTGPFNAFFGASSGLSNTIGGLNSFFGAYAGDLNTEGSNNSFFGTNAGGATSTGNSNTFFGMEAGDGNTTGSNNTALGQNADVSTGGLSFATAIGSGAVVSTSNTVVLGRSVDKVQISGTLILGTLIGGAGVQLCHTLGGNGVGDCGSSLRYKTNLKPYLDGLDLVSRLHPISFNWKDGGMADLGLGAEDVEKVQPLLVTYNKDGQVEGVKYDRIGVVLINAVREQQTEIYNLKKELEGLKALLCRTNPHAAVCK